jgi:hypothetical protein
MTLPSANPLIKPEDAVRFAWAMSQVFSKNEQDRDQARIVEAEYTSRLEEFKRNMTPQDIIYIGTLIPSIRVTLRNLCTYLKHRDDNFGEAEKLRDDQIKAVTQLDQFALNFETAFPKIASSTAIGGVAGLTLTNILSPLGISPQHIPLAVAIFLGLGYLITEAGIVPLAAWRTKRLIKRYKVIKWDYYKLYVERCKVELQDLLNTMKLAYKNAYGTDYKLDTNWKLNLVLPGQEGCFDVKGIYDPQAYYDPKY